MAVTNKLLHGIAHKPIDPRSKLLSTPPHSHAHSERFLAVRAAKTQSSRCHVFPLSSIRGIRHGSSATLTFLAAWPDCLSFYHAWLTRSDATKTKIFICLVGESCLQEDAQERMFCPTCYMMNNWRSWRGSMPLT